MLPPLQVWTEFFLFTLFATYSYTFESADLRVARTYFDRLAAEYSCGQFVRAVGDGGSLVVKEPGQVAGQCSYGNITSGACMFKDLIDWPNNKDSLLAADDPGQFASCHPPCPPRTAPTCRS